MSTLGNYIFIYLLAVVFVLSEANTTPPPSTTRAPLDRPPWYLLPHIVVLAGFGVATVLILICIFCGKACASAMCPKTAQKLDYYCEYECCDCPRVGQCCGKCQKCCCPEEKKKKKRRRKRNKGGEDEGQWWAYYPGIGWGPAPPNMVGQDGGQSQDAANPGGWDAGYDYQNEQWSGGSGAPGPGMGADSTRPGASPPMGWEAGYDYQNQQWNGKQPGLVGPSFAMSDMDPSDNYDPASNYPQMSQDRNTYV